MSAWQCRAVHRSELNGRQQVLPSLDSRIKRAKSQAVRLVAWAVKVMGTAVNMGWTRRDVALVRLD